MSSNWNVYKVFKNGKRAKAPLHHFMFQGNREGAIKHFNSIEIKNLVEKFGEKSSKINYCIINDNDNQALPEQTGEEKFLVQQIRVLAHLIREKNLSTKKLLGNFDFSQLTKLSSETSNVISNTILSLSLPPIILIP